MARLLASMTLCLALLGARELQAQSAIVSQAVAQRHGLTRAWHAQIELDRSIDKIAFITQQGGMLYVQTTHATVHALDAETGKKVWAVQIGRRDQVSLAPGVNAELLAVINGSSVFVVDRRNGKLKYEKELGGAPGAGPALSKHKLYVGMVDGLMQGFDLDNPRDLPWVYKSSGRILIQPVVTDISLAWTTDRGYFYVADDYVEKAEQTRIRFRVESQGAINARPAHWTPFLYACSLDGYVYGVNETSGKAAWKFSAGHPINKQPVAVEKNVWIVLDSNEMICLDGKTGAELWTARGITDFLSTSPTRVYCTDYLNRLVTLDRKSGAQLDVLPLGDVRMKMINQQSDRIYLASFDGLVQCLHETGLDAPVNYAPPKVEKKVTKQAEPKKPAAEAGADDGEDAPAADMPADGEDAKEGMDAADEDNPFGN